MASEDLFLGTLSRLFMHERDLEVLYATCAISFPGSHAFWTQLANEERGHATWAHRIMQIHRSTPLDYDPSRVPDAAVEASSAQVRELTRRVIAGTISEGDAASQAMDVENSVLEGKYLDFIISPGALSDDNPFSLGGETARHKKSLFKHVWRLKSV